MSCGAFHKGQLTPAPSYAAFRKHPREWEPVFRMRERKTAQLAAARLQRPLTDFGSKPREV